MDMTPAVVGTTCILKRFNQDCYNFAVDLAFFLEKLFVGNVAKAAVAVAQLVESGIVIPVVVGSSPIGHPKKYRTPNDSRQVFFRLHRVYSTGVLISRCYGLTYALCNPTDTI